MNAFEELKAWCEKYLKADEYKVVPESKSYSATIYFTDCGVGFVCFDRDGDACGMGSMDEDDMFEHIEDYERTEKTPKPDPIPTSIGGMMVRKMIEAYERNMNK